MPANRSNVSAPWISAAVLWFTVLENMRNCSAPISRESHRQQLAPGPPRGCEACSMGEGELLRRTLFGPADQFSDLNRRSLPLVFAQVAANEELVREHAEEKKIERTDR